LVSQNASPHFFTIDRATLMKPIGVRWLMVLALAAGFTCAGRQGDAADYPTRPIRVVVPYAAGGADTFIRPLVSSLEKKHGITLVIETVVGAGGMIGVGQVKRSNPDGYTLLFCGSGALAIAPAMAKADYKIEDFSPILDLISIPYVLAIKKDAPYKTVQGLIEFARANPGRNGSKTECQHHPCAFLRHLDGRHVGDGRSHRRHYGRTQQRVAASALRQPHRDRHLQ
jgi:tripartite-type tricarboxylate transporter receptor subunit TctC